MRFKKLLTTFLSKCQPQSQRAIRRSRKKYPWHKHLVSIFVAIALVELSYFSFFNFKSIQGTGLLVASNQDLMGTAT